MRLQLNPDLVAYPFDGAGSVPQTVCELPHSSGRPVRLLVPSTIYRLLCACPPTESPEALVSELALRTGNACPPEKLASLVREQLLPRHILVDADLPLPISQARRRDTYLLWKVRLLRPPFVSFCARRLLWLTSPRIILPLTVLVLLTHLFVYFVAFRGPMPSFAALSGPSLLLVALALTVEVVWHEFGHSTSLVRFGGQRPEIGWGIYLWYSVFFADLSEAWRLPRRQRVCIDLGGMYFQSMFLLLYAALWLGTHRQVWFHIFYLSDLQLAANLNPFLRMDGYWALIDALGLNSLRGFSLMSLLRDVAGRGKGPYSALPAKTQRIILGYTGFSLLFYAGVVLVLVKQTKLLVHLYPATLAATSAAILGHAHWGVILGRVAVLGWRTLLLGAACAVVLRMAGRLIAALLPKSVWQSVQLWKVRKSYA